MAWAVAWSVACALALVATGSLAPSPEADPTPTARGLSLPAITAAQSDRALRVISQTTFVRAGERFVLEARLGASLRADTEVVLSVLPGLRNRSEFQAALSDAPRRSPLGVSAPVVPGADGNVSVEIGFQDPVAPRDPDQLRIGRSGVHPVIVEVRGRDAGPVLSQTTTFLVHLIGEDPPSQLLFSLVLGSGAPLGQPTGSGRPAPRSRAAQADDLAVVVEGLGPMPITLAFPAYQVDPGFIGVDQPPEATLARLRNFEGSAEILATPYGNIDLLALLEADLAGEIDLQLRRGQETLATSFARVPNASIWASATPIGRPGLDFLSQRGLRRVVVDEGQLDPVERMVTLTSPFTIASTGGVIAALAGDPGLAGHFANPDPVLGANQLLADLAVLFFDLPGTPRGAVALAPVDWQPQPGFTEALGKGLEDNPLLRATGLDALFDLPPAQGARSRPLERTFTEPDSQLPKPIDPAAVKALRSDITALGTILGANQPAVTDLDAGLLLAEGASPEPGRSGNETTTRLGSVQAALRRQLARIRIPQGRAVTITARQGLVPVTFQNETGLAALVRVEIQSDKLTFPDENPRLVELSERLNTTAQFRVQARTSGAFPVRILVTSRDGTLTVGEAVLTVRSTAAPGLGLAIAAAALAFLLIWWGRNARSTRRARTLISQPRQRGAAGAAGGREPPEEAQGAGW